jgi:hypothetical protein
MDEMEIQQRIDDAIDSLRTELLDQLRGEIQDAIYKHRLTEVHE